MMQKFSRMLEKWELQASQSNSQFGAQTLFKVQVNFYIPTFQGKIDEDVVDDWLSKLERYFCVNNFSDIERITFILLKVENYVKLAWKVYVETKEAQVAQDEHGFIVLLDSAARWEDFVEHIKMEYYPEDTYE